MHIEEFNIYIKNKYITINIKENLGDLRAKIKSINDIEIEDIKTSSLADYLGYEPEPINHILIRKYFLRYGTDLYTIVNLGRVAFQFSREELYSIIFFIKDFTNKDKQFNKVVIDNKVRNLYAILSEMSMLTYKDNESISFDNFTFFNKLVGISRIEIYIKKENKIWV